jgi:hypothetical protein
MFAVMFAILAILAITIYKFNLLSRNAILLTLVVGLVSADVFGAEESLVWFIVRIGNRCHWILADQLNLSQVSLLVQLLASVIVGFACFAVRASPPSLSHCLLGDTIRSTHTSRLGRNLMSISM